MHPIHTTDVTEAHGNTEYIHRRAFCVSVEFCVSVVLSEMLEWILC